MEAAIQAYISAQPAERQAILAAIHSVILETDSTVKPVVEPMMGKEMIIYKCDHMMKYGLASVKKYMSLHVLPMYMAPVIHQKYQDLLSDTSFQKGCINFETASQMPAKIIRNLIADCSKIDILKIREDYLKSKKAGKTAKR